MFIELVGGEKVVKQTVVQEKVLKGSIFEETLGERSANDNMVAERFASWKIEKVYVQMVFVFPCQ